MARITKRLDRIGIGSLIASIVLFVQAAANILISLFMYLSDPVTPQPQFTLLELGIGHGIIGMAVLPIFITTTLLVSHREKTGHTHDTNVERRTAGRSGPDREHE